MEKPSTFEGVQNNKRKNTAPDKACKKAKYTECKISTAPRLLVQPDIEEVFVVPKGEKITLSENTYYDKLVVKGELDKRGFEIYAHKILFEGGVITNSGSPVKENEYAILDDGYSKVKVLIKELPVTVVKLLKLQHPGKQGSSEWLKAREAKITASDVATVLDMDPYSSSKKVFKTKTYQTKPFSGSFATRNGHTYEPAAAAEYSKRTKQRLLSLNMICHPVNSYLAASVDRVTVPKSGEPLINVEIKCPSGKRSIDEVPPHYLAQVQVQMECLDIDVTHFVQYKPPKGDLPMQYTCFEVLRDKNWFKNNEATLTAFWKKVVEEREAHPKRLSFLEREEVPVVKKTLSQEGKELQILLNTEDDFPFTL